ncbi:ABC transporter ATP-binding protein [Rheinheimera nanhaiensis]|uniref:Antibiotic transport system ATP-binding protein n=1 Tax=Rheinheimera nanhaiensis E407-8 TaxID=562729 RepID=I1DXF6_9GAMM|nr:ABC transporter ATP-binding protein [Rheinheimera nanhaiensis]GAB58734.1 antibiotic transport system ATP-binding protein [Rheinheimera nanhaiensis E407-8]
MLQVSHLTRRYGAMLAVNNVSFTIKPGEIVGLLGHNGAGKTTIMKMLTGYLDADSGSISLNGADMAVDRAAIQAQIGYLPESLPLYPDMTVADYLDYAATLKGLSGSAKTAAIRYAIAATDIAAKLLAPIATLSRGFKQRVGVAQAILSRPKLLILDEPTNGLDPAQTEAMRNLIRQLAKDATVILSTHIMQEVDALCSQVLMLRAGELVLDSSLSTLRQSNSVQLHSTISLSALREALAPAVAGLEISQLADGQYRLTLNDTQHDLKAVCQATAQAVFHANASLSQLFIEQRDLETVFRQLNSNTEVQDAA